MELTATQVAAIEAEGSCLLLGQAGTGRAPLFNIGC